MKKNPHRVAVLRAVNRLNSYERQQITVGDLLGIADDVMNGVIGVDDIDRQISAAIMANRLVRVVGRPSPEPTDDFNREYQIAPWSFDA